MENADSEPRRISQSESQSPIDLNISRMTVISLKPLDWFYYELPPKKLKITNTGKNVVLCGNWPSNLPYLTSGPFSSKYLFSQIHFHWGANEMIGSEHFVDGGRQPMELHAVHFKSNYSSQQLAKDEDDGIVMLVYFFKLQSVPNSSLEEIIDSLPSIQHPNSSARIEPFPIMNILRPFVDDYFLYRGSVPIGMYHHKVMWLISREPIPISLPQLTQFRSLTDKNFAKILNNCRPLCSASPKVFYVDPKGSNYASLVPVPQTPIPLTTSQKTWDES